MESTGEFATPRTHTVGNSIQNPDANLRVAGDAVLPPIRLLQADTEETDNRLVAHRGTVLLGCLADKPGRGKTMAGLTIGREHRCAAAGFERIQRSQRTAAVVGDHGRFRVDLADLSVPYIEQADEPLLPPREIGTVEGALLTGRARQIEASGVLEISDTVLAVAHTGAIPAINEKTIDVVTRHDLSVYSCHELEVVGTITAGDPHLGRRPVTAWFPVDINRDPVRVCNLDVVIGGMRIRPHEDGHV